MSHGILLSDVIGHICRFDNTFNAGSEYEIRSEKKLCPCGEPAYCESCKYLMELENYFGGSCLL